MQYRGQPTGTPAPSTAAIQAAADSSKDQAPTSGVLAFTGAGSILTYAMIASLVVIAVGGVLVTRRRRVKTVHRR